METPGQNKPIIDIAAPPKPATTPPATPSQAPAPTSNPTSASSPGVVPAAAPAQSGIPVAQQPLTVHKAPTDQNADTVPESDTSLPDPAADEHPHTAAHLSSRTPGVALAVTCTVLVMVALSAIAILIYIKSQ